MIAPARRSQSAPAVPRGLVTASEWAWRSLAVAGLVLGFWFLLRYFSGEIGRAHV